LIEKNLIIYIYLTILSFYNKVHTYKTRLREIEAQTKGFEIETGITFEAEARRLWIT